MTRRLLTLALLLCPLPAMAAITVTSTCSGTVSGTQYVAISNCTVSASGGTGPYTYSISTSSSYQALPAGLSIGSSSGVISGTDYDAGVFSVQVIATDSTSATGTLTMAFNMSGNYATTELGIFPSVAAGNTNDSIFTRRIDYLPVASCPVCSIPTAYQGYTIQFLGQASGAGIPYITVPSTQSSATVVTETGGGAAAMPPYTITAPASSYPATQSAPIPDYQPVEGTANSTGDKHTSSVLLSSGGAINGLCEQWEAIHEGTLSWQDSTAVCWSSSQLTNMTMPGQDDGVGVDAAGLPLAAALLTYDALMNGTPGMSRFTLPEQAELAYHVSPATNNVGFGGNSCTGGYHDSTGNSLLDLSNPPTGGCSGRIPNGMVFRLTAAAYATALAACPVNTNPQANAMIKQLRQHGTIFADNGGYAFYITLGGDARWSNSDLNCATTNLTAADLEPVNTSGLWADKDANGQATLDYKTLNASITGLTVSPTSCSLATGPTAPGTCQLTPTATYNDTSTDQCQQAGGATWAPLSGNTYANVSAAGLVTAGNVRGTTQVSVACGAYTAYATASTYVVPTSHWLGVRLIGAPVK